MDQSSMLKVLQTLVTSLCLCIVVNVVIQSLPQPLDHCYHNITSREITCSVSEQENRTMASDPQKLDQRSDTVNSEFYDNRRKAHRVFRDTGGRDRFNPFRHIAWISQQAKHANFTQERGKYTIAPCLTDKHLTNRSFR